MKDHPQKITLEEWDAQYQRLRRSGMKEPVYGGPLRRHAEAGDLRLLNLKYDNSAAALRLWNFLLTEEERLHDARAAGKKIVGTMKDLGTVPVMAYSLPNLTAFYPDGAWWTPCIELSPELLEIADSLGIPESFCPVRAMLGAFVAGDRFPIPDLLVCSVGATCDDFSSIAQRLDGLGHRVFWWEIPHRRRPDAGETAIMLPGGFKTPASQVRFVKGELNRVKLALEELSGRKLTDEKLESGIKSANRVRRILRDLREAAFSARICPMPALELLVAEMLAIHFCSDRDDATLVLDELLKETMRRVEAGQGVLSEEAVKVFWVNPVADIRVMNLLEECGGRLCGSEYLFCHAMDHIPEDVSPMEALARTALADPMVGSTVDRAERICHDMRAFGSEALVISRIPGASHCAFEGTVIGEMVRKELGIPVVEIEVPPVSDSFHPTLRTRIEALIETAKGKRRIR
jgi:benzoyl-CoA reductase/2-hydroxyglutaryl-CoA dehydratase subunit BcrC/BadD/HgdB